MTLYPKIAKLLFVSFALSQLSFINLNSNGADGSGQINLENIKRISRSCYLIQHEYYDPTRIQPQKMLEEGFYELAKEVPEILPRFLNNQLEFHLGTQKTSISLSNINRLYDILYPTSQAFDFIHKNYKGKEKFEDMEYAFIAGILSVLDPHSNILPPKVYDEFKTQTQGEYGGLGIVISIKDKELTVVAPIEDTPAYSSGILADDKIMQINNQSTTNMTLTEAVELMRGPPKTTITLKIKSKNRDPRDVVLTREVIVIKSVQAKLITQDSKFFGVLRIKGFQEDTYKDVLTETARLNKESDNNLSGIVLDLRNNPGGLLDQAIMLADLFLSQGDIVITTGTSDSDEEVAVARKESTDILTPMVILINEGSASASEIVAGAFKNNNRAVVMGEKSFGKGSVQSLFNLREGSSLKLTVAQYLTPGRESIQAVGILPDIHLYPAVVAKKYYDLHEDTKFGEEELDAHLQNQQFVKESKPTYELTYLKEIDEDETEESSYTSKIKENEDFPLKLALSVLSHTQAKTKTEILEQIKPLIAEEAKSQDQLMASALKDRGIDWSQGLQKDSPQLSVSYKFLDENGHPIKKLNAGVKTKLSVSVKNIGTSTVYRILSDTDALNPLMDNKEFVFGSVAPGQEKHTEVEISVPSDIINFTETIKLLTFSQNNMDHALTSHIPTNFIEKAPPRFSYSYKLIDGNTDNTKGNNNGIPEKGEEVILQVSLKNLGPGVSEETSLNIKNTQGKYVFLKKARENIGMLQPNSSITKDMMFNIKDTFNKNEFEIDVFAMDDATKASISDTLKFSATEPVKADPAPDTFQLAPTITISQDTIQTQNKLVLNGEACDSKELKDISIFAKGRKLIYINLQDKPNSVSKKFSVEIPLEEGINPIVIQARGDRDLSAQKTLSVVYHEKEPLLSVQQP